MEPGSPSTTHIILDRDEDETLLIESANNLEEKTIPDLVEVLRVAYLPKTFDDVEAVLLSKDLALRNQIQDLDQNVEMVKQQLQEEKLARLKAEEEVKKSERVCVEGKKLEQRYTTLLKELKSSDLASDRETNDVLRKRNIQLKEMWVKENILVRKYEGLLKEAEVKGLADIERERKKYEVLLKEAEKERYAMEELKKKKIELECEVKKLMEKRVVDGKAFDVLRTTTVELEHQIMKLKGKKAEDDKSLDELREKNKELKETVNGNLATISRLKKESSSLAAEKRKDEILFETLNMN
ncbi:hypothetical protein L195_g005426 [Trifolium pratense]|uniref:Uncharacterized protein n=1 Tax=Trifolium pratense TaxID=57577 RepID=A0A2K3P0U0_TRIPR|nr:hypothetical protein L195_g005426 [Trifolium pratense]